MNRNFKIFAITVIVLFSLVIVSPWVLHLSLGDEISDEGNGGLTEKRELAKFPTSFSNNFFSKFNSFYEDHSPFRNNIIAFETRLSQSYETYYRKTISPKLTDLLIKPEETPAPNTVMPGETATPSPTINIDILFGNETPTPESTPEPTQEVSSTAAAPTPSAASAASVAPVETNSASATKEGTPSTPSTPDPTATPCNHSYDNGTVTKQATCTQEGEKKYTCKYCGNIKTEKIAKKEHNYKLFKSQTADDEHFGYKVYKCSVCGSYMQDSIQNKTVSSGYLAPQYGGVAIYGRCDWLFYSGDGSESYYQGTNLLSSSEMASWKNTFERLQNACDKKGITLVIMVAPNKEQIYSEYMPTYKIATDEKRQDRFLAYMQKNSSVKYLYPYNDLITAKYFYDVFYKQDTHWNAIGGFMGSMALYRALGMSTTNLFDLNITEHTRFGGDLSNFSGFTSEYTDYIVNYKPEVKTSVQYFENSTGGENELCQYTSDSANDAKIVVIADSFRHAMSQYISKDFARATISHRSDVGRPVVQQALSELSKGDVLFLLAVERYDYQNVNIAEALIDVIS